MQSKQHLKNAFSTALQNSLLLRYGELPSAAFIAKEYNLRQKISGPITQESARRWLKGLAIAEFDKLIVLRSWLDLDLNALGMPDIEILERKHRAAKELSNKNLKRFVDNAHSIKKALHQLMNEIEDIEKNITISKKNT